MKFSIISTVPEWESLSEEWNQLFSKSIMQVPFLSFAYQRAWWQTLGGGEWQPEKSCLQIFTARESGSLVGIAPLFLSSRNGFEPALRFIGSIDVSDYLDFLVEPGNLVPFLQGLLEFMRATPDVSISRLDLYNLRNDSPTLPALQAACDATGWEIQIDKVESSPFIRLSDSWESYLATINKKQRHEIRRKLRNAEARHEAAWYYVQDQANLKTEMDDFINMMCKDHRKEAFMNEAMVLHMQSTARQAFEQGVLHLSFLTMDGHKAAAFMSLLSQDKLLVYNSAWEPAYAPCSPGWVLLSKVIQWSIGRGIQEVDMMRGDEAYKYKFGAVDRFVMRAVCTPK